MAPRTIVAGLGATALFALGVGAALADSPPTTTDSTTSTSTTTTQTDTTTTTQTTTTSSSTTTTELSSTDRTTTSAVPPPSPKPKPPRRVATVPAGASRQETGASRPEQPSGVTQRVRRHKKRRVSKPLRVTPPLGQRHFVFPVAGPASFGDTYGAFRGDVHGKWHHGDDIFAALGTPVVAVAGGTVNRIGWRPAGGWRLWVRDSAGDEFYYAHLSGYARSLFHSKRVRAGQVIGFVGDTGDAYSGEVHLHFEIHPRQLLRLRYDGAVDPTTYLESWMRLTDVDATRPLLPRRFPKRLDFQQEARAVFHELLIARHLISPPVSIAETHDRYPAEASLPAEAALAHPPAVAEPGGGPPALAVATLAGLAAVALFAAAGLVARAVRLRRQKSARGC